MGFDTARLVQQPAPEDLLCIICRDILEDPVEGSCEHPACRACLLPWLDRTQACPQCRACLPESRLKPAHRHIRNRLDALTVTCDNAHDGCHEILRLDALPRHVQETCGAASMTCPFPGCQMDGIQRQHLHKHIDRCPRRLVRCPSCNSLMEQGQAHVARVDMDRHLSLLPLHLGKLTRYTQRLSATAETRQVASDRQLAEAREAIARLEGRLRAANTRIVELERVSRARGAVCTGERAQGDLCVPGLVHATPCGLQTGGEEGSRNQSSVDMGSKEAGVLAAQDGLSTQEVFPTREDVMEPSGDKDDGAVSRMSGPWEHFAFTTTVSATAAMTRAADAEAAGARTVGHVCSQHGAGARDAAARLCSLVLPYGTVLGRLFPALGPEAQGSSAPTNAQGV
eukprot:jgi/Mesvir1/15064/Mv14714-RA.1